MLKNKILSYLALLLISLKTESGNAGTVSILYLAILIMLF